MRRFPPLRLALALTVAATACHRREQPRSEATAARDFLARNARQPGVVVLPDGLQYKVVRSGPADGPHPQKGDEIKVDYTGQLIDGTVFDSTRQAGAPVVMKLDHLVPGWMDAVPRMRPGDEWILFLPPKLGYGSDGRPPAIPPDSVLVFDLALLGVLPSAESAKLALNR